MPVIEHISTYKVEGRQFDSREQAEKYVNEQLEEQLATLLQTHGVGLSARQSIIKDMLRDRAEWTEAFNVTYLKCY